MLPSGPRSTYPLPSTVRPDDRAVVRQILASVRAEIAKAAEVRTGLMTTGCDGDPVINPLDGSTCNNGDGDDGSGGSSGGGGGTIVLFNPPTRKVFGTLGKVAAAGPTTAIVAPATCAVVLARLRKKRRFTDNLGNVYGPDGEFLTNAAPAATLETDYVHQLIYGRIYNAADSGQWDVYLSAMRQATLEKTTGVPASISLGSLSYIGPPAYPTVDETGSSVAVSTFSGHGVPNIYTGLNDAVFAGAYDFAYNPMIFGITIDTVGATDTFWWENNVGGTVVIVSGVPITGAPQTLSHGVTIQFGATTGHTLADAWYLSIEPNNHLTRPGVAVRGTIDTARACVNGGFPNNNVIVTSEDDLNASHVIRVRDADSLSNLNSLSGHTGITTATGERLSFSANDEGFFFAHFYATDGNRKIAVISVNPLTFAPTITEIITLAENSYTAGSTFAIATTLP